MDFMKATTKTTQSCFMDPLHQNQNGLVEIFFWAIITEISVKNSCFQLLAAVTAKQTAQLVQ